MCVTSLKLRHNSVYLCARHTFLFSYSMTFLQKNYIILNEYAQVINRMKVSKPWWASHQPSRAHDPHRSG